MKLVTSKMLDVSLKIQVRSEDVGQTERYGHCEEDTWYIFQTLRRSGRLKKKSLGNTLKFFSYQIMFVIINVFLFM